MRISATSLLSLAAGVVASVAVAASWVPLSTEAAARAAAERERDLGIVASLVADALDRDGSLSPALIERARNHARARALLVLGREGETLASSPEGVLLAAPPSCPGTGTLRPDADLADAPLTACARVGDRGSVLLIAEPPSADGAVGAQLRATLMFLALGLGVGVIVAGGTRWILSPVESVSQAAVRITRGDRGVRVPPRGPAELAQLARAVNALAGAIETREDEIEGRLEVVTQLSSMVAHEVRNPLQTLSLLCTLARTEEDLSRRTALLQKIEDEIHVLEGVVQRFLRNSGPLQISRSQVDLVTLVRRAVEVAELEAAQRGVRLLVQLPGRLAAHADGSLVRRAIENLMLNAIQHASASGSGQVTVALVPGRDRAEIFVDDNGPGVAPEDRERIFEAYYSAKPGGTGLGLALVRQVIAAHGGSIACLESPIGGARFLASLPLRHPGEAP